jgi:hypothetical protein
MMMINITQNEDKYITEFLKVQFSDHYFFCCILMISLKVYLINLTPSYLVMTQALLLQITIRQNSNIIYDIFSEINRWFRSNLVSLNYDKSYLLLFVTKTNQEIDMQISCN